jgi:hypothetical protein
MTRQANSFTRDLDFLVKKRGYTIQIITAKLGPVEATWTVEEGVERPMYSATFYETS